MRQTRSLIVEIPFHLPLRLAGAANEKERTVGLDEDAGDLLHRRERPVKSDAPRLGSGLEDDVEVEHEPVIIAA